MPSKVLFFQKKLPGVVFPYLRVPILSMLVIDDMIAFSEKVSFVLPGEVFLKAKPFFKYHD